AAPSRVFRVQVGQAHPFRMEHGDGVTVCSSCEYECCISRREVRMRKRWLMQCTVVGLAMMLGLGLGAVGAEPVNPASPGEGDAVHLVDERGDILATVTVTDVERDWTGYKSTFKPRQGVEFVAFTLEIKAVEGDLELNGKDFDLQRDPGILEDSS